MITTHAVTVVGLSIKDQDLYETIKKYGATQFWDHNGLLTLLLGYPTIKKDNIFYVGIITKAIGVQMYPMWVLDGLYEKMKESLEPYGLWDEKLFGIWTILKRE